MYAEDYGGFLAVFPVSSTQTLASFTENPILTLSTLGEQMRTLCKVIYNRASQQSLYIC